MSDLARLLQQYGYGEHPNALAQDGVTYDTSNVLAGMPKPNPLASALRTAMNAIPENKELPPPQFFMDPRSMSMANMLRGGLDTAAGWLDYGNKPQPSDYKPSEMLAPLGAGLMGPAFAPTNAVGMFGGRLAKTADHAALARAEEMSAGGFSRNDIRQETGWFKDAGGNWRFEIPDNQATATGEAGNLGRALVHPALYEAYPQLKNVPLGHLPENSPGQGAYLPKIDGVLSGLLARVAGGNPSARIDVQPGSGRSTLLHEAQHAVDDIEGMFKGVSRSNPYGVDGGADLAASAAYRDAPFEKSARAVQNRADMTPEERSQQAPWLDYGDAAKGRKPPRAMPTSAPEISGVPLLPERAALEEAYRQLGMDPADKYSRAAIEAMKGHWNERNALSGFDRLSNSNVDMALGRNGYEGSVTSQDPRWRNWGNAMEEYYKKAQTLGHNGGPEPSTWEDPFIYSLKR